MKKILLLTACFMLIGCGQQNSSLDSSSSVSSEEISQSASSTVSSQDENQVLLAKGGHEDAIKNEKTWFYSGSSVNLAKEDNGTVTFAYGDGAWDDVQLFFHDSALASASLANISITIKAPKKCNITINGEVVSLREGTNDLTLTSKIEEGKALINIIFGTSEDGLATSEYKWTISSLEYVEHITLKSIVEDIVANNNYTIVYEDNSKTGKFIFNEKYAHFYINEPLNDLVTDFGFIEDDTGIFAFTNKNNAINANSNYCLDASGNPIKGLYETKETLVYNNFVQFQGVPSLHSFVDDQLDVAVKVGESFNLTNNDIANDLLAIVDYKYLNMGLSKDKTKVNVGLNENGELSIKVNGANGEFLRYTVVDVNNSSSPLVEEYISQDSYGPGKEVVTTSQELLDLLAKVKSTNYAFSYEGAGISMYKVVTENYLYREVTTPDQSFINGQILVGGELKNFTYADGEITLSEGWYNSLSELLFARFSIFNDPTSFVEVSPGVFRITLPQYSQVGYDMAVSEFAYEGFMANHIEISSDAATDGVKISLIASANPDYGIMEDISISGIMSDIGTASVEGLDSYLESL